MRNKSLIKLWLMAMAVCGFGLSFTSAATIFHLDIEWIRASTTRNITEKMMYVHFADNDNNFGWFLYFSNGSWDAEMNPDAPYLYRVGTNAPESEVYDCRTKIKWFYYNAERWERLWPLDEETWTGVLAYRGLTTTWWIYVNCVKDWYSGALASCLNSSDTTNLQECQDGVKEQYKVLGFGYYGSVSQTYSWKNFNLTVWVQYQDNGHNEFISIDPNSKLSSTFENLDNQVPVWFVYDYNGWVWLAWCRFNNPNPDSMRDLINEITNGISDVFQYDDEIKEVKYIWTKFGPEDIKCDSISVADTLLRVLIEWIVWMNEGGNEWNTKFWSLGNSSDTKMQYFGTKTVSNATLMNYAVKKAELLCRWKWKTINDSVSQNIICIDNGGPVVITWDLAVLDWKTLIIKNWDFVVKPFTGSTDSRNYDVYLLNGNLIIDESEGETSKFVFNTGWFISDTTVESFSVEVHDALCPTPGMPCDGIYIGSDAAVWSFIRWNFIVNGLVKWLGGDLLKNKYFIYGKFTTRDTFNTLEKTFSWTCENWFAKDGNYCPEAHDNWYNPYRNAALIVIDQNYGSPLLE